MDLLESSKINSCNEGQINSSLRNSLIGKYDSNLIMEKCSKNLNYEHNTDVLKSFNWHEKERFRQLISQSSFPDKDSFPSSASLSNSSNLITSENPYQKYIRTTPKQIFDDIGLTSPGQYKLRNFSRRPSLLSETVTNYKE
jgi:hypothetical protein